MKSGFIQSNLSGIQLPEDIHTTPCTKTAPPEQTAHKFAQSPRLTNTRLLYICDWLPPDYGAVGQYSVIFAREMAAAGCDVTLAGLSSSGDGNHSEDIGTGRYRVIKLRATPYDKASTPIRVLWTVYTNTYLVYRLLPMMKKTDTILFTGSPPLFLLWISLLNLFLRKRLIYRITDFHPECTIAQHGRAPLYLRLIYHLTLFCRRRVHMFEVVGLDQGERLAEIGIPPKRITFKPDPSPVKIRPDTPPLERPQGTHGKFLLLYSGNWGVAHDYITFVEAYHRHYCEGPGNVLLWLNAVGSSVQKIAERLASLNLPFIRGKPVPLDQLASLLVTPDAHLITLSDPFVGYVLPSKVHGCIQSGKPVLFIGSARSDVHRICAERARNGYQRVDVGDIAGATQALGQIGPKARQESQLTIGR